MFLLFYKSLSREFNSHFQGVGKFCGIGGYNRLNTLTTNTPFLSANLSYYCRNNCLGMDLYIP